MPGMSGAHISAREAAQAALARLAERQHAAARCAAAGGTLRDCAALMGVDEGRAAGLMGRPAMRELVAHYQKAA